MKNIRNGFLAPRTKDTHKGDYGHVFVLAGSRGMTGAAALCANACLRSGAGMVTLGIPSSLNIAMEAKLTEVMTCPLQETTEGTVSIKAEKEVLNKIDGCNSVIMGPGLSQNKDTVRLLFKIIPAIKKRMVLDADALNAISGNAKILKKISPPYIVTPHHGEMSRLVKRSTDFIARNRKTVAKEFAGYYNAVTVLKGFRTVVAGPGPKEPAYINNSGNPGMATAGSGDVLTGVIGGFLAQGLKAYDAARLGVYVHGLAGDMAAKEKGQLGLIASDILEKIPEAIKRLAIRGH